MDERRGERLVFGDLLTFYEIPIEDRIEPIAKLYEELKDLERVLFSLFISFIMAKKGFYNITIIDLYPWDKEDTTVYTTEFSQHDWIDNINAFSVTEEYRQHLTDAEYEFLKEAPEWTVNYQNQQGDAVHIQFLTGKAYWYVTQYEESSTKKINIESLSWSTRYLKEIDRTKTNYIVVSPLVYNSGKALFQELNSQLSEDFGHPVVFSVDGFVHQNFPDQSSKEVIISEWISIREQNLMKLHTKWPMMSSAKFKTQIYEIKERLSDSTLKYAEERYEDALKDAALACEHLLQILHYTHKPEMNKNERMTFNDLLCNLKESIVNDFGENTYNDLDFIRIWRNKVSHPPISKPTNLITYQVVERAKIFYESFEKWRKNIITSNQ